MKDVNPFKDNIGISIKTCLSTPEDDLYSFFIHGVKRDFPVCSLQCYAVFL